MRRVLQPALPIQFFEQGCFIEDRDVQIPGLVELRAGIFARHKKARFSADRAGHFPSGGFNALLGIFALQAWAGCR